MAKPDETLLDLTQIIESTEPKYILSLDIEGAPRDTTQVSVIDGEEKSLFNTYCTGGRLTEGKKGALTTALKKAKILIGYNIESDLTAMAKQGIIVSMDVIVVDLYFTVQALLGKGIINKNQLPKLDLQAVAEYYGIKNISGYHNSLVDATATMKLFWAMYEKNRGFFWLMPSQKVLDITEPENSKNKDSEDMMNTKAATGILDYSYETEDVIYKSSGNLYEALVMIGEKEQIIRMTKAEYNLYKKICKFAPGYPLRVFYQTILAPGQITAVRKFKEQLEAEKEAANDVINAAFENDKEETNSDALESEEPESINTSDESEAM